MVTWDDQLRLPVIVTMLKGTCDIEIPDLEITVHGKDYISVLANAITKCTAIYYYSLERNLPFDLTYTYQEVEELALKKGKGSFAQLMKLCE